jgi:5-methylcytosine-specific restriction endonuclease McrA
MGKTQRYYDENPEAKAHKKAYDSEYQKKKKQVANRVKRNAARRAMERKHGKKALEGKDVDHINPLSGGGSNSKRNLRITSKAKNRGRKT